MFPMLSLPMAFAVMSPSPINLLRKLRSIILKYGVETTWQVEGTKTSIRQSYTRMTELLTFASGLCYF